MNGRWAGSPSQQRCHTHPRSRSAGGGSGRLIAAVCPGATRYRSADFRWNARSLADEPRRADRAAWGVSFDTNISSAYDTRSNALLWPSHGGGIIPPAEAREETIMGLLDVLHGMQNGPRGPREPGTTSGGMSKMAMALIALLGYKHSKASPAPSLLQPRAAIRV